MKAELSKVRQTYSVKYQEFINKIQGHADEVIIVFLIQHFRVHLLSRPCLNIRSFWLFF